MSVTVTADDLEGAPPPKGANYINAERGIVSWLTTVDHKRIGLMYLVSVLVAFALGGFFALALRRCSRNFRRSGPGGGKGWLAILEK